MCSKPQEPGSGGGLLLLLLLFANSLTAQGPGSSGCLPFEFEVVKVDPNLAQAFSTPTTPGAFQMFYKVRLKVKSGVMTNLPLNWNLNYLAFNGEISVNRFSSRINVKDTKNFSELLNGGNSFSPNPYAKYLTVDENGEVDWVAGEISSPCNPSSSDANLTFPASTSAIDLFVIVVDAGPGDFIFWKSGPSGTIQDCITYNCIESVNVALNGPLLLNFPAPPVCNPVKTITFDHISTQSGGIIAVSANGLTPGQVMGQMDGVIHIVPQMSGLNNFDLGLTDYSFAGGPTMHFAPVRKNADGSFDIYFQLAMGWSPSSSSAGILAVVLDGAQYNLSQGASFLCSSTFGRVAFGGFPSTICSLTSVPSTVVLPGYPACSNVLKVTVDNEEGANCELGFKYTFTHSNGTPLALSSLKLVFAFKTETGNQPGTIVSGLPCPSCGSIAWNPDFDRWEYTYTSNGPLSIVSGTTLFIPFTNNRDCISYFANIAEATPVGGATCALGYSGALLACNPEVYGKVHLSDYSPAPNYQVRLEIPQSPVSGLVDLVFQDCEQEYSFCPPAAIPGPFQVHALMQPTGNPYLCGVSTYDLVLISKHILGLAPLPNPYLLIAADANRKLTQSQGQLIPGGITTLDIVDIRKCILGIEPNFGGSSLAASWHYINDEFVFPNPINPFQGPSPETWTSAHTWPVPSNGYLYYGNFTAIKAGDVNLSCNCDGQKPRSEEADSPNDVKLRVPADQMQRKGAYLEVPVYADAPFALLAAQAGLRFDPSSLRLLEVVPNKKVKIGTECFGLTDAAEGKLRFAWACLDGESRIAPQELLFTLRFEVRDEAALQSDAQWLWESNEVLDNVAYREDGLEVAARVDWQGQSTASRTTAQSDMLRMIVSPNPFQQDLHVFLYAREAATAVVRLLDAGGNIRLEQNVELHRGDNPIVLQAGDAPAGIYLLSTEVSGQKVTRRIVKI